MEDLKDDSDFYTNQTIHTHLKSNRKAIYRNWGNQKANPALKTKAGNK